MKFLIPTILTLLFFSPTPVFADEVSDVGLVCERTNTEIPTHSAFWFKGNQKLEVYVQELDAAATQRTDKFDMNKAHDSK